MRSYKVSSPKELAEKWTITQMLQHINIIAEEQRIADEQTERMRREHEEGADPGSEPASGRSRRPLQKPEAFFAGITGIAFDQSEAN